MAVRYSPLRYPGGKGRFSGFLAAVIETNGLSGCHYVEPFAGGAGAALRLLFEEYVDSITINDADPRIAAFWQAITRSTDRFLERLAEVEISVAEWHRQRAIYDRGDLRSPLDLGFATFFLNRTTRSGIVHNGGPIGGYGQTGKYKIDARFNRTELARRIVRIAAYSDRITVSAEDGLQLLKSLNAQRRQAAQSFVYLDPPYYRKGAELYMNRLTHKEHVELAMYLRRPKRFSWILTYDDVPAVREMYAGCRQSSIRLSYSAYERRQGSELLVYSDTLTLPAAAAQLLRGAVGAGQSAEAH